MFAGKRVRLRALERSDLPEVLAWRNDPEVVRWLASTDPLSMADEERWLDRVTMSPNHKVFAIQADVAGTSRHIGNCGFHDIDLRQQHAVFGILIGAKELWGQGYGTEATEVLLRAGFYELNLHRIALDVIADNARARRSYEKIGFVLEGTKRQDCFREGRFRDVHLMSMLRDEYTAKYGAPR